MHRVEAEYGCSSLARGDEDLSLNYPLVLLLGTRNVQVERCLVWPISPYISLLILKTLGSISEASLRS